MYFKGLHGALGFLSSRTLQKKLTESPYNHGPRMLQNYQSDFKFIKLLLSIAILCS